MLGNPTPQKIKIGASKRMKLSLNVMNFTIGYEFNYYISPTERARLQISRLPG